MPAYQLRMKQEQPLEDFIGFLAKQIWDLAAEYFDPLKIQSCDLQYFENEIKIALQPFIRAYDLCGSFKECSDEVEGAPWLDYDDRIYMLSLPGKFPEFIEQMSAMTLESIRHLTKPKLGALLYETIQDVFRRHFAEHLYFNPVCRRIAVCNDSRPVYLGLF